MKGNRIIWLTFIGNFAFFYVQSFYQNKLSCFLWVKVILEYFLLRFIFLILWNLDAVTKEKHLIFFIIKLLHLYILFHMVNIWHLIKWDLTQVFAIVEEPSLRWSLFWIWKKIQYLFCWYALIQSLKSI